MSALTLTTVDKFGELEDLHDEKAAYLAETLLSGGTSEKPSAAHQALARMVVGAVLIKDGLVTLLARQDIKGQPQERTLFELARIRANGGGFPVRFYDSPAT